MVTLYHFLHCPYCIRVRIALDYLKIPYRSVVVSYDDRETPERLVGEKIIPVMEFGPGDAMKESLDIIRRLDEKGLLFQGVSSDDLAAMGDLTKNLGNSIHPLAIPFWISFPEFSVSARNYFLSKQAQKRGPLTNVIASRSDLLREVREKVGALSSRFSPFFESDRLTIKDVILAAHLWNLYVVPEFQFPTAVADYLQRIKEETSFDYFEGFWQDDFLVSHMGIERSLAVAD